MIVALWVILRILFIATFTILCVYFLTHPRNKEIWQTLKNGFKLSLKDCGFHLKSNQLPIELYELAIIEEDVDEEEICDDCYDMLGNHAMDIASWMEEGFPKHPPSFSKCGGQCRCELILTGLKTPSHKSPNKNN